MKKGDIEDVILTRIAADKQVQENENTGNPKYIGYYLVKTITDKWGIVYWDGVKFWDDPNQDGKLSFGLQREYIKSWFDLPNPVKEQPILQQITHKTLLIEDQPQPEVDFSLSVGNKVWFTFKTDPKEEDWIEAEILDLNWAYKAAAIQLKGYKGVTCCGVRSLHKTKSINSQPEAYNMDAIQEEIMRLTAISKEYLGKTEQPQPKRSAEEILETIMPYDVNGMNAFEIVKYDLLRSMLIEGFKQYRNQGLSEVTDEMIFSMFDISAYDSIEFQHKQIHKREGAQQMRKLLTGK